MNSCNNSQDWPDIYNGDIHTCPVICKQKINEIISNNELFINALQGIANLAKSKELFLINRLSL